MRRTLFALNKPTYLGMTAPVFKEIAERACPFVRDTLGAEVVSIDRGKLNMRLPFKESFVGNPVTKVLHGGVTAALMDHVGGFCAMTSIEEGNHLLSTVDLRIDYVNPAPPEEMLCEAVVTSSNTRMIRADVTCWNNDKTKIIATARGLYNRYKSKTELVDRTNRISSSGLGHD
jgi:uncharacterized protein (TIGR00369 family)